MSGVYGWIDWESPDINDDPTVTSERPPYVPEDNWAFSVSYGMALDGGASLTPRVDLYGQAEICSQNVFVDSTFPGASCTDAYELVNVRLEWRSSGDTWTVAVGATNVTDEEYFYNKFDLTAFGQPHAEGQPAPPARVVRDARPQFLRSYASRNSPPAGGFHAGYECVLPGRPLRECARAARTAGRSRCDASQAMSRGVCADVHDLGRQVAQRIDERIRVDVGDRIVGTGEPGVLRERGFEACDRHREALAERAVRSSWPPSMTASQATRRSTGSMRSICARSAADRERASVGREVARAAERARRRSERQPEELPPGARSITVICDRGMSDGPGTASAMYSSMKNVLDITSPSATSSGPSRSSVSRDSMLAGNPAAELLEAVGSNQRLVKVAASLRARSAA